MNTILSDLRHVFTAHFDVEEESVTTETSANDIEEWDSFAHVSLMSAIEERFNISFTGNEIVNFKTVGDVIKVIQRKAG